MCIDPPVTDYKARCADLRRQRGHYVTIAATSVVATFAAITWILLSPLSDRPYWVSALAIAVNDICILLFAYNYRICRLMSTYAIGIERFLYREKHLGLCTIHQTSLLSVIQLLMWFLVFIVQAVLGLVALTNNLTLIPSASVLLAVVVPVIIGAAVIRKAHLGHEMAIRRLSLRTGASLDVSSQVQVMLADYEIRCEDFRFLADYYTRMLLWASGATSALMGIWIGDREAEWVFLLIPLVLLLLAVGDVAIYRRVRVVKLYASLLESQINSATQSQLPIAFFSEVREKHVHGTGRGTIPLWLMPINVVAILLAAALITFMIARGLTWATDNVRYVEAVFAMYLTTVIGLAALTILGFSMKQNLDGIDHA